MSKTVFATVYTPDGFGVDLCEKIRRFDSRQECRVRKNQIDWKPGKLIGINGDV